MYAHRAVSDIDLILLVALEDVGDLLLGSAFWGLVGFLVGCAAGALVHFGARRSGLLAKEPRWPRIVTAVVLVAVTLPLLTVAGCLTGARDGVTDALEHRLEESELDELIGAVIETPLRLVAGAEGGDASYLLETERVAERVDDAFAQTLQGAIEDSVKGDLKSQPLVVQKLARVALARVVERAVERAGIETLLGELEGDSTGRLGIEESHRQLGRAVISRHILARVDGAFNALRLQCIAIALGLPLLVLVGFRFYPARHKKLSTES